MLEKGELGGIGQAPNRQEIRLRLPTGGDGETRSRSSVVPQAPRSQPFPLRTRGVNNGFNTISFCSLVLATLSLLCFGCTGSTKDSQKGENACTDGRVRSGERCCWPGQKESPDGGCEGEPECPDGTLPRDGECEPGCTAGKALQAGHCCWLGERWDSSQGTCSGLPSPGVVELVSGLGGAAVSLDGVEQALTQPDVALRIALGMGEHKLLISKRGYLPRELELSLLPGEHQVVRVDLEPAIPAGYVLLPAGTFTMGSPSTETDRLPNEQRHEVTLSRAYYLKATEVTQAEFRALMGTNPSHFLSCGEQCPVERVRWQEAVEYCRALSREQGLDDCYDERGVVESLDCDGYRLPTEAEWEYAARAGELEPLHGSRLDDVAWHLGNSGRHTHPVAQRRPNAWGLYDMLGNVWEWTGDGYVPHPTQSVTDPTGSAPGRVRAVRGGSWYGGEGYLRFASRAGSTLNTRDNGIGFRCARTFIP